jgi:hypothetical protein
MAEKVLNDVQLSFDRSMQIFSRPASDLGITDCKYLEYKPLNAGVGCDGPLRFHVPNAGSTYTFLPETKLKVKFRLLKADRTPLPAMPAPPEEGKTWSSEDSENANMASVACTNNFLHSLFDQIEVYLGDTLVTKGDTNYPLKAMINTLLETSNSVKRSKLQQQLFFFDTPEYMDSVDITPTSGVNKGLVERGKFTAESKSVEIIGTLDVDVFKIEKYLLNSVPITVNLFPTSNAFRLMSGNSSNPNYVVDIQEISLIMCHIQPASQLLVAHQELLSNNVPATYYYVQNELRKFTIPKNSSSFYCENMFNSVVPDKIYLVLCDSEQVFGSYTKNPYNFKLHNLSFINLTINGSPIPKGALQINTEDGSYVDCFEALHQMKPTPSGPDLEFGNCITREAFLGGYGIICLDLNPQSRRALFYPKRREGSLRLELRFSKPISETLILLASIFVPNHFSIDFARNIFLEH